VIEKTFSHQVPGALRELSRFDWDTNTFTAPDGRVWIYTDDPDGEGVSWRDERGDPIHIAVWLDHSPGANSETGTST
jgi:hypothetical protein